MNTTSSPTPSPAQILREYPFAVPTGVHGVTHDGKHVWFAADDGLRAFDPDTGEQVRHLPVAADAGTAFDGKYLYQIAGDRIQKIDPDSGAVVAVVPAPGGGQNSGMAWAEGSLWIGRYEENRILQVDPLTGAVLRSLPVARHVTGVSWAHGELWHGTWEAGTSDLRRIDPQDGRLLEQLDLPAGAAVSGLEFDGRDRFFCGGANEAVVRAVQRPPRP
ncbi:glutamine cyclotransferase [Bordetella genomosp. 5]|uniref:Vgb family protein n=1 Tax=Bordetella genomosp. 5 TaxID=1395608 RepID=UPI000B9DE8BF|nr:glutamine cyclotransferase [Bordetella genomosp. 5]OZI39887.1 glutamine cyclotransferase [Bordetella genomosp. 5]